MTRTILLVEDNEQNRYLATFLLEASGHRVLSAENGPRAIAIAPQARPDIILLDIHMPGMDGYAVAQALRATESLRNTPIIAVSGHAMVGDREKAMVAGCTGCIEKPINPETFAAEVNAFLTGAPPPGPPS